MAGVDGIGLEARDHAVDVHAARGLVKVDGPRDGVSLGRINHRHGTIDAGPHVLMLLFGHGAVILVHIPFVMHVALMVHVGGMVAMIHVAGGDGEGERGERHQQGWHTHKMTPMTRNEWARPTKRVLLRESLSGLGQGQQEFSEKRGDWQLEDLKGEQLCRNLPGSIFRDATVRKRSCL